MGTSNSIINDTEPLINSETKTETMASNTPYQNLSLFIPRVHNSFTEEDVANIFNRLKMGTIRRVDLVVPGMKHDPHQEIEEDITSPPEPLPIFNIAFIHYSSWNMECEKAVQFYKQVFEQGEEVRIQYDQEGHFFKVFKNKNPKPDEQYELEQAFVKQQQVIQKLKQRCSFYEALFHNMEDLLVLGKEAVDNAHDWQCVLPKPPFVVGKLYHHTDGAVFKFVKNDDGTHDFILVDDVEASPSTPSTPK